MLVSFIRYSFTYIPTPVLHWISGVKCLSISPFSNDCLEGHFEVIDFQTLHFGMTFQIATVLPSKLPCVGFSYFVGTVMPECFCVWEREWPVKIYSPDHHLMWECCYPYSDLIMRELGGGEKPYGGSPWTAWTHTSHHWFIQQELWKTTLSHALVLQKDSDNGCNSPSQLVGAQYKKNCTFVQRVIKFFFFSFFSIVYFCS